MYYYQFNIGDYQSHTAHLSEMEDLAYRRLLDWYYLHESPIPNDLNEVARQIRMRSHSDCITTVLLEYFEQTPTGWIHNRADMEIEKVGEKSTKASKSAKIRWEKVKDANALPTQSDSNATHNTLPITQDTEHKTQKKATVVATPVGVSDSVWQEFVSHRKSKKARVTQLVIDGIQKEASIAGWSLEDALKETIVRNWQSFKADWVKDENLSKTGQKGVKLDWDATWRNWVRNTKAVKPNPYDVGRLTVASKNEPDPALLKIEEDAKKAAPIPLEVLAKMAELRRKA